METFCYRSVAILCVIIIIFLSLCWIVYFDCQGQFWQLDTDSCRELLASVMPLLQEGASISTGFEPLGFFNVIWYWLWNRQFSNPAGLLAHQFLSFPGPAEPSSSYPNSDEVMYVTASPFIPEKYGERSYVGDVKVAIFHTHTSETYSGDTRQQDASYHVLPAGEKRGQVVDVGEYLALLLERRGISTIHDATVYDGVYSLAYVNARSGIKDLLASFPALEMILDIHRDGLEHLGREAVTVKIGGRKAARIMFIISGDRGKENLIMARELAKIMEEYYPGLLWRVEVRQKRGYNQDLHPGLLLVEVGGVLNTREEALYSAELLSNVIIKYLGGM